MKYQAFACRDGAFWTIEFPGLDGLVTDARSESAIERVALEALESWLGAELLTGAAPPRPVVAKARRGQRALLVQVPAKLASALTIRWARKSAGLSQVELAKRAGLSQQAVARLEKPTSNPTVEMLARLAEALGSELDVRLVA